MKTHEVVEVPIEVVVPVDDRLTEKGELAKVDIIEYMFMSSKDQLIHITALYHWNTTRALQCYGQLDEIRALGRD